MIKRSETQTTTWPPFHFSFLANGEETFRKKALISFCFCELVSACNYSLNGYFIPTSGKRDRSGPREQRGRRPWSFSGGGWLSENDHDILVAVAAPGRLWGELLL